MTRLQTIFVWLLVGVTRWQAVTAELSCSTTEEEPDPALKEMKYDIGYGEQTFMAYVEPDVTTFYQGEPPASKKVVPNFNGLAAKFINMSNNPVRLYWENENNDFQKEPMGVIPPMSSTATAAFVGNRFILTPESENEYVLKRFVIRETTNIYHYDPYDIPDDPNRSQRLLSTLADEERRVYQLWKDTLAFNDKYMEFTGRSYLANYLRKPPIHFMWRADYFGQQHWVETKETHFVTMPPKESLRKILEDGTDRILDDQQPRVLQEYRTPEQSSLNFTLTALSCAPRVFEIKNFLSQVEVDHILEIASKVELQRSLVGDPDHQTEDEEGITDTRTSLNSWLSRDTSPIIDAIYRRAADVMRIDESLLRNRDMEERPDIPIKRSMGENLQLVHYDPGQEYTSHHDWGVDDLDDFSDPESPLTQGTRFATLLFYLNDDMEGGETAFPRWANAETFDKLRVNPEARKAVLFYSQLPDGNLDDLSQHASLPVRVGEKWLINLWTWDPLMR